MVTFHEFHSKCAYLLAIHMYVYPCTQYNCCCCIMYGYFYHIVIHQIVQFYYQHFAVARTEGLQQHARFSLHTIHSIQLWIFPQSLCHTAIQFPPVMQLLLLHGLQSSMWFLWFRLYHHFIVLRLCYILRLCEKQLHFAMKLQLIVMDMITQLHHFFTLKSFF